MESMKNFRNGITGILKNKKHLEKKDHLTIRINILTASNFLNFMTYESEQYRTPVLIRTRKHKKLELTLHRAILYLQYK